MVFYVYAGLSGICVSLPLDQRKAKRFGSKPPESKLRSCRVIKTLSLKLSSCIQPHCQELQDGETGLQEKELRGEVS